MAMGCVPIASMHGKVLEQRGGVPMLLMMDEENLSDLHLPSHVRSDFICSGASDAELEARARQLLGDGETVAVDEVLTVDNLTINLATYQVSLDASRLTSRLWNTRCSAFWQRIPTVRTAAKCCCIACGASSIAEERVRSMSISVESAARWSADRRTHLHGSWCGLPV